jgi:hypothetical protein
MSVCPTVDSTAEPLPRSVLILNQSTSLRPFPRTLIDAISTTMEGKPGGPISYYVEHADLYRFNGSLHNDSLKGYFSIKYRDNPIGVIIAIGPAGLDLALELRRALWPTTPVVFDAVDADTITHELPRGVTGTFVHIKLANTVGVARAIVPDLRQIAAAPVEVTCRS